MKHLLSFLGRPLLALALSTALTAAPTAPAVAQATTAAPAQPSLAEALNPDGTLRPGATGSFDARRFRLHTAPNGQPVFRPTGTSGADDYRWQSGFGLPNGANGGISAVVRAGNNIYIGGSFNAVSNVAANHVARWDGTAWSALGSGLGNGFQEKVTALAVAPNGDLYAAGGFVQAGSVVVNSLARWNGTTWSTLGSGLGTTSGRNYVNALAVAPNGDLYAGGEFTQIGGTTVSNVARWNGMAWSALGSGIGGTGNSNRVYALAVAPNGDLYAGGYFGLAGGATANNLARWNGTAWNALGTGAANGLNNEVRALAVAPAGDLYAGGGFSQAGGVSANNVARWNGTAWNTLGTGSANGVNGRVYTLALNGSGDLYAGGNFGQAGGVPASSVARWNGTAWNALGAGIGNNSRVSALAVAANGDLFAAAGPVQYGTVAANGIARWNGTAWNALGTGIGNGLNDEVEAVAVAPNGDVYVTGLITQAGTVAANGVTRWNGTAWNALGAGLQYQSSTPGSGISSGSGYALALAPNGDLYVGGIFNLAGGVAANGVARWNGTAWSALGAGLQDNNSAGDAQALALAPNGDLYVGGFFTMAGGVPANGLARWNGTAWSALGSGLGTSNYVYALAVAPNGDLYAGGEFTQVGGTTASNVARWNGTAWSALGSGISGTGNFSAVVALAVAPTGDLYAGGLFTLADGVPANGVARWNGSAWNALGTGLQHSNSGTPRVGAAYALALAPNGDLCLGGVFDQAGGTAAANVARWNGSSFSALGSGLNSPVLALAVGANNKVCAGGIFGAVGDGSKTSVGFAIYDPAAVNATRAAAEAALPLYPNPAQGHATVQLLPGAAKMPLLLLDALGREVRRYPIPTGTEATLDLRGLPVGVYVLRSGSSSQRLVVE